MEDVYLSTQIDERRAICISTLSAETYRENCGTSLGGDFGYFIYEVDLENPQYGIEIMAKAASLDAAIRLYDIISTPRPQLP